MNSFAATCQQLIEEFEKADNAWLTPSEVARRIDGDVDATTDLLADLDVAGMIVVQERADGVYVALSPYAVRRSRQSLGGVPSSGRSSVFAQMPVTAGAC